MSEITKLYENAGIEKDKGNCTLCPLELSTCIKDYNKCPYYYPPFTTEKQIKLIKLLAKGELKINNEDGEYEFSDFGVVSDFSSFEESLADFTNRLWQDLTPEEKQQVKGILE